MKKALLCLFSALVLVLSGVVYFTMQNTSSFGTDIPVSDRNVLVVYFSRTGTTETAAVEISREAPGDLHRVSRSVPYPENLKDCVEEVSKEMQNNTLPDINEMTQNIDKYNVIFLCYPIWLNSIPMPMVTFMEENDLSGKYIIPVATHSGSGFGNSISIIKSYCKDSMVLEGIELENGNEGLSERLKDYGF